MSRGYVEIPVEVVVDLVDAVGKLSACVDRFADHLPTFADRRQSVGKIGTLPTTEEVREKRRRAGQAGARVTNARRWGSAKVVKMPTEVQPPPRTEGAGGGGGVASANRRQNGSAKSSAKVPTEPASVERLAELKAADVIAASKCTLCDEHGWRYFDDDRVAKCDHGVDA
jgi:hypothetical protein